MSEPTPVKGVPRVLSWAKRRQRDPDAGHPLFEIGRFSPAEAVDVTGLPRAAVDGIRSFYDQLHDNEVPGRCSGTACRFAGGCDGAAPVDSRTRAVHCYGRCYQAPVRDGTGPLPIPRLSLAEPPVVLRHLLGAGTNPFDDYLLPGGDEILATVLESGLRGRGGAAFLTGAKWKIAREAPGPVKYVVANGDEGDPGSYIDRLLLEESPHAVLAGMQACARAAGATHGIVFVRGEYPLAAERVRAAVLEASSRGHLADFDVTVITGAGSYVAGEETALLRAILGLRAEPSPKPPYPAQCGLYGCPTIVQNIETLSVVPWIVRNRRRGDTKAVSLSGAVATPGIVEVTFGTPLSQALQRGGGGPRPGARWKMALVGGPMGRVLPASAFDTPVGYDTLPGLGHAGVVVLDDTVSAKELARHLATFSASESCGNCTPCRLGTKQLDLALAPGAPPLNAAWLDRLLSTVEMGSLCGFGQGVPRPFRDLLLHFREELLS